jgi:hypothetical protein
LSSKLPTLVVLLVLLWRKSIIESFLFMLNHQDTTCQTVKQFEDTGNVCDKHAKEHKSSISIRTEVIGAAQEAITGSPRTSVQLLGLGSQPALYRKSAMMNCHCYHRKCC